MAKKISELAKTKLNYSNILLDSPIKFNGVYNIQVILHAEVVASILIVVAKTESEAQDALIEFKEGGAKAEDEAREAELASIAAETYQEEAEAEVQDEIAAEEALQDL